MIFVRIKLNNTNCSWWNFNSQFVQKMYLLLEL